MGAVVLSSVGVIPFNTKPVSLCFLDCADESDGCSVFAYLDASSNAQAVWYGVGLRHEGERKHKKGR